MRSMGAMVVAAAAAGASAGTLFSIDTNTSELVRIDSATGAITAVGPTGIDLRAAHLTYTGGTLWAMLLDASGSYRLTTIDTSTGATGPLVAMTLGGREVAPVEGLASDKSTGELYVSFSRDVVVDQSSEALGRVSSSGVITEIGPWNPAFDVDGFVGLDGGGFFGVDRNPALGGTLRLASIDTAANLSVLTTRSFDGQVDGLADFASAGDRVWAADFVTNNLHTFDAATGALIGSVAYDPSRRLRGLAVPTPGSAGIAGAVLGLSLTRRRRR